MGALEPVVRSAPKPPAKRKPKPTAPPFEPDGAMVAGWYAALQAYPASTHTNSKTAQKAYYAAIDRARAETGKPSGELTASLNERIVQYAKLCKQQGLEMRYVKGFHNWLEEENWNVVRVAMEAPEDDEEDEFESVMQRIKSQH